MNIIKKNIINISITYSLYINIFNKLKIIILSNLYSGLNHRISIKLSYIFLYKSLYNLFKIELKTLQNYLKTNLILKFI